MQVTEKINHWGKQIEVIKPALFVDTLKSSRRQSELAKKEDKDCVVRAFMGALDISYDQAHAWVKKNMNREDRKGTYTGKAIQLIEGKTKNGYKIGFYGFKSS